MKDRHQQIMAKSETKKRHSRKKKGRKGVLVAILIGIAISLIFLYQREISHLFRPKTLTKAIEPTPIPRKKEKIKSIEVDKERIVVLYFSDQNETFLVPERTKIAKRPRIEDEAKELVDELIKGPKGKLVPTFPPRTKLLGLRVEENGTARVDFSRALATTHPGGSSAEMMTVYSLVNSLTSNFPEIRRVQILVEGKEIETIAGHLSLRKPLTSRPDLIKAENKKS